MKSKDEMKKVVLLIILTSVIVFNNCKAQEDTTATVILFKWDSSVEKRINAYHVSNDTIFEHRGRTSLYEDTKKLTEFTTQERYFYFFDKKNRLAMEGYWDCEGFYGKYLLYYKNGVVKEKGVVQENGLPNNVRYKKNGQLR